MLGRPLVAPSAELSTGRSNQRSLLFPKFPETMEAVKGIIKTLLTIFFLFRYKKEGDKSVYGEMDVAAFTAPPISHKTIWAILKRLFFEKVYLACFSFTCCYSRTPKYHRTLALTGEKNFLKVIIETQFIA